MECHELVDYQGLAQLRCGVVPYRAPHCTARLAQSKPLFADEAAVRSEELLDDTGNLRGSGPVKWTLRRIRTAHRSFAELAYYARQTVRTFLEGAAGLGIPAR